MNTVWSERIKLTQATVALIRDVAVIAVFLLTALIVYLGGDPGKLNALDWAKLVVSAIAVVIAPVITFFVVRTSLHLFDSILEPGLYVLGVLSKVPRGYFLWLNMRILKRSPRAYVASLRGPRAKVAEMSGVVRKLIAPFVWFHRLATWWNVSASVFLALVVAAYVFYKTLTHYAPIADAPFG